MSASPCPAWRRVHWEAKGRLKPEYDAVVIGAGKSGRARAVDWEGSPAQRPGGTHSQAPPLPLLLAQDGQELGQEQALWWKVHQSANRHWSSGDGSAVTLLCGLGQLPDLSGLGSSHLK